jgi:hypothetical protein
MDRRIQLWGSVAFFFVGIGLLTLSRVATAFALLGAALMFLSALSMIVALLRKSPRPEVPLSRLSAASSSEDAVLCPKCGSQNVHAEKRGYSLASGVIGSGDILLTCLKCGHGFEPGRDDRTPWWQRKMG